MFRPAVVRCTQCYRSIRPYFATPQPNAPSASQSATSAAQPLSTPMTPAAAKEGKPKKEKVVKSICEAGTVFKGLNIMKNGTDPVARAEAEYPPFLWTILEDATANNGKKEARKVNRATIKRKNFFSGKL